MSLRKLCFFTVLAAIVAFPAVGRLYVPIKRFETPTPNSRPQDSALAANGLLGYEGPRADKLGRSAAFLPVQSKDVKDLGAGKLLVASRGLGDPIFAKTVVLLVQHDDEGVVGLILNRRSDVPLSRVLEGVKGANHRSDPVYLGGPVETPGVFALLQSPAKLEGAQHVFGAVYLISAKALFEQTLSARPDRRDFHVYLGYAGWTKDQLRKEMELGAWFIFPPDAETVFDSDPDSLWLRMIQKTELKWAGNEPADADQRDVKPGAS
jgi:putative transcriptional regulator